MHLAGHCWSSVTTFEVVLPCPRRAVPVPSCRVPAFARLVRLLGIQRKHCLACGVAEQKDFIACITPDCKGGGGQWEEGQDPPHAHTPTPPCLLSLQGCTAGSATRP